MATRASWIKNRVGIRQAEHQGIEGGSLRYLTALVLKMPGAPGQGGASLFGLPQSCCLYCIEPSQISPKLAGANALAHPYFSFAECGIFCILAASTETKEWEQGGAGPYYSGEGAWHLTVLFPSSSMLTQDRHEKNPHGCSSELLVFKFSVSTTKHEG